MFLTSCNFLCQTYGYVGGGLSAFMFLPQLLKIHNTKSAKDISWVTLIMANFASTLILLYTISTKSEALMYTSSFSIMIRSMVMIYKCYLEHCKNIIDSEDDESPV